MRCPKCGYISFDHNDLCPNCSRNLATERQRLNLISYTPDPPYLLGGLLGDVNESGMHYHSAGSGAFNVLDQELDLEAETAEMNVSSSLPEEETEIEIELDSISDKDQTPPEQQYTISSTEVETLATDTSEALERDQPLDIDPGQTLDGLEIENFNAVDEGQEAAAIEEEPEPLVFEMQDITLEDSPNEEEFDLELIEDDLSEVPTEVFETESGQGDLTLEEDAAGIEEIAGLSEPVVSEQTIALIEEQEAEDNAVASEPEIQPEPPLSLEEVKDDDLGEVDVAIDESPDPTQKLAEGHGG